MSQQDRRSPASTSPSSSVSPSALFAAPPPRWVWAALVGLITAAWANALGGAPVFDDHFLVAGQDCFRTLRGVLRIFRFESEYACTYRPARYISYGVDNAVFGGAFWGFHLGSVLRHGVAALAVGGLVRELGLRAVAVPARRASSGGPADATSARPNASARAGVAWLAVLVAAFWAMHPVQTDSVSYVSGRRDILAGLWTFVSVWTALIADRRGGLWWLVPLWTTLFAFLSKESAVVIPALFLMWKITEVDARMWLRGHLATAISGAVGLTLSFLMVLYRGVFESQSNRGFEWWGGTAASNFATVAALQVYYVRHVFLAHPLIGDYKPDTIALATGFSDPRALLGLAIIVALLAIVWLTRRRRPLIAFGIGWYLVSLTPVSHVFPHHELFAEHYLYIPLFGAVLALVDAGLWALERAPDTARWKRIGGGAVAALLVVMAVRVVDRNRDFVDERTFYENVVAHAPGNLRAVANLGNITFDAGEYDEAVHWLSALAPLWVPGSNDERHHVTLLLEAAVRADRPDIARAAAEQLAEHHPDIGVGHRWVAQLAAGRNDHRGAFDGALRWWDVTLDPRALGTAVGAWHAGGLGLDDARALAARVEAASSPDLRAVMGTAAALRVSGDAPAALDLLLPRRPTDAPPEIAAAYDREICAAAASLDTPPALPYCDADAPD